MSPPPSPLVSSEVEKRPDPEHNASRPRTKRTEVWERAKYLLLPWSGMLGAGTGWVLAHQIGSDTVQNNCRVANPILMLLVGVVGVAIIAFGGVVSWRAREREEGARLFLAYIGALMAALFAIALFLQTSATFLLPRCFG